LFSDDDDDEVAGSGLFAAKDSDPINHSAGQPRSAWGQKKIEEAKPK